MNNLEKENERKGKNDFFIKNNAIKIGGSI